MDLAERSKRMYLMSNPEYAELDKKKKELEKELSIIKAQMYKFENKVHSSIIQ